MANLSHKFLVSCSVQSQMAASLHHSARNVVTLLNTAKVKNFDLYQIL